MVNTVLFICSGNYYRSRFAEILFNHLASMKNMPWRASSRGVYPNCWTHNPGPISPYALRQLEKRAIPLPHSFRYPRDLTESDLAGADRVVAMKREEHQHHIETRFSAWQDRIEYWDVHDLDCATDEVSMEYLEKRIYEFIDTLSAA